MSAIAIPQMPAAPPRRKFSSWQVWGLILIAPYVLVFIAFAVERTRLAEIVARYSTLALFAFVGVAASGVVSAWLRLGQPSELFTTGYGQLVMLKTGSLLVLGVLCLVLVAVALRSPESVSSRVPAAPGADGDVEGHGQLRG